MLIPDSYFSPSPAPPCYPQEFDTSWYEKQIFSAHGLHTNRLWPTWVEPVRSLLHLSTKINSSLIINLKTNHRRKKCISNAWKEENSLFLKDSEISKEKFCRFDWIECGESINEIKKYVTTLFLGLHISRKWLERKDKEEYHLKFSLFKHLWIPHCHF